MKRLSLISIILFLTVSAVSHAQNDSNSVVREKRNTYTGKAYKAVSIHADIFSPAMGIIGNKDIRTGEIQADMNLYYKFFPTLEAGYGSIRTSLKGGQEYRAASPFVRVGFNYNLINNADKDGRMKHKHTYEQRLLGRRRQAAKLLGQRRILRVARIGRRHKSRFIPRLHYGLERKAQNGFSHKR